MSALSSMLLFTACFCLTTLARASPILRPEDRDYLEYDHDLQSYLSSLGNEDVDDVLKSPVGVDYHDLRILKDLKEYERLKEDIRNLEPFLDVANLILNEEDDLVDRGYKATAAKRALESIDKEDDWLIPLSMDTLDLSPSGSLTSHARRRLSKKDIESLIYQPDPALTVHELPVEPQISFRKQIQGDKNDEEKESEEEKQSKNATEKQNEGQKEVFVVQPAPGSSERFGPFGRRADPQEDEEELHQLAASKTTPL